MIANHLRAERHSPKGLVVKTGQLVHDWPDKTDFDTIGIPNILDKRPKLTGSPRIGKQLLLAPIDQGILDG
jgi:hypothetical protein